MDKLSKTRARKSIDDFFAQKVLKRQSVHKIKRLAMQFNIRLGKNRERFCKKCDSDLKSGKVRVTKTSKTVICSACGFINKMRISK